MGQYFVIPWELFIVLSRVCMLHYRSASNEFKDNEGFETLVRILPTPIPCRIILDYLIVAFHFSGDLATSVSVTY